MALARDREHTRHVGLAARRRDLGIAPRTVNTHLEHLFRKLHVETPAGAAAAALKMLERT
ncbi:MULTISPECIES: LuxR C-terminal-related transcriptional regulator [Burkholderia]|uniref:LuxR C-terminal-related transcriptional regulator n=1 Tax=Burkholderia TaxID=32008 RepID=UPI0039844874